MAAQHLPQDLVRPNSGLNNWLKGRRRGSLICLCVFAPQLSCIHDMQYALNGVFFTARGHWSKVLLSLFAVQYSDFTCFWISSSSFSDAFIHTPRDFTWSKISSSLGQKFLLLRQKIAHHLGKRLMEQAGAQPGGAMGAIASSQFWKLHQKLSGQSRF